MYSRTFMRTPLAAIILTNLVLLAACSPSAPVGSAAATVTAATTSTPDWFNIEMTDVQTGQTFTIHDFAGKVVLIETMAEWCPTCTRQENEVIKLHQLLGSSKDLISISLDVDLHEDEASLKEYAANLGYDWYFAVAPLEVARALGNLYSAEYLNPPFAPMLLIDRDGGVFGLPYGLKSSGALRDTIAPYLTPQ
jgi:cytochrome oxidase Cu insertion factor (SCO1/SenC/PrrC family)